MINAYKIQLIRLKMLYSKNDQKSKWNIFQRAIKYQFYPRGQLKNQKASHTVFIAAPTGSAPEVQRKWPWPSGSWNPCAVDRNKRYQNSSFNHFGNFERDIKDIEDWWKERFFDFFKIISFELKI